MNNEENLSIRGQLLWTLSILFKKISGGNLKKNWYNDFFDIFHFTEDFVTSSKLDFVIQSI